MIIKRAHGQGNPKTSHTQSTLRIVGAGPRLTKPNKTALNEKRDWKKDPLLASFILSLTLLPSQTDHTFVSTCHGPKVGNTELMPNPCRSRAMRRHREPE